MNNMSDKELAEKIRSAFPEKEVPNDFDRLIKNACQPIACEEPPLSKSRKAYIFLIAAIIFILLIIFKK